MAEVIWSPSAKRDLVRILSALEAHSELYAQRFAARVDERVRQLERFPAMGHQVPEFGLKQLRQTNIGDYRFIYWELHGTVHLVRTWHSARLLRVVHIKPPSKGRG